MFTEKQIKDLASEAYKEFSKKYSVRCEIAMIDLDGFWKLAKKSKLIQDDIKKNIPLKVGAFVLHGEIERIYLNPEIVNQLSSDPKFVKALVMHELSHIYLKNKIREDSLKEEIKSENRVSDFLNKEFPKYSGYLI
jgi:hypothetical protein